MPEMRRRVIPKALSRNQQTSVGMFSVLSDFHGRRIEEGSRDMDGCREMIADDFDAGLGINCGDFGCRCESCVAKLEAEVNHLEMIACTEVYDRCKELEAANAKLVALCKKLNDRWVDLWEGFDRIDGIPINEVWTLDDLYILRKCKEDEFPLPGVESELLLGEEGEGEGNE